MPADLDLTRAIRQRLEQHRARLDAGGTLDDRPRPEPRIIRKPV
jgi:hypothetical protein